MWRPMKTAPRDGTIIEVRWFARGGIEYCFRARWLAPCRIWVDWDRQHVELQNLKGWRPALQQFRAWTKEEEAILAELHGPEGERLRPDLGFPAPHAVQSL
jgi:hypothetical protein